MSRRYPSIPLPDAVVIVTGGARGIGRATAQLLHDKGAVVIIGDIDIDVAQETAREIGAGVSAAELDVTLRESWAALVDGVIKEHGRIDVLVNNAGVMPLGAFADEPETLTDLTLGVNVRGPIHGMRAVLPHMTAAGRGHIVNVASMAGKFPIPGMVVYNASKFGAVGLTAAARVEYRDSGISVSAVLPGAVRTELASGVKLGAGLPTVDPEDVAQAIVSTVSTRRAETPIPRVLALWSRFGALIPEPVLNLGRRLANDRRGLEQIDDIGRQAYADRLKRHAG